MSQAAVASRFYGAFARKDAAGMAACAMWAMLLGWTPWFHAKVQAGALRALAACRTKASGR